jgi:hypothetical protein
MEQIAARWERLGVMFNVASAPETPDVERLLLDTVRAASHNSRFFIMAASWLSQYGEFVAKRRLTMLVRTELEAEFQPIMGFLLEWAQKHSARNRTRFQETIRECRAATIAGPLADVDRGSEFLRKLSREQASVLSLRWGCWMEDFEIKHDALRVEQWVSRHNRLLGARAICGGDLVASILAEAGSQGAMFESESALSRFFGASRAAVRDALAKLRLAGYVQQTRVGRDLAIQVKPQ